MPTVPVSPEVLPQSGGVAPIPDSPLGNASAQGGLIGTAVSSFGIELGRQVDRMQSEVDVTDARNAVVDAESELRRAMYAERQLTGRAAVGATERLTKLYGDLLRTGSEKLSSGARGRFQSLMTERRNVYLDGMSEYEGTQRRQMRSDALRRTEAGALEGIALDPRTVDDQMESGLGAIYEYAALENLDQATTGDLADAWVSTANAAAISEAMVTDPEYAEKLLTDRAAEIEPAVRAKLRDQLTPNINKQRAYRSYDAIAANFPGDFDAQLKKASSIDDADVRSITEGLVRTAHADAERVDAERQAAEKDAYFDHVVRARDMDSFQAATEHLRRNLTGERLLAGIKEMESAFGQRATGARSPSEVSPDQHEARLDFIAMPTDEIAALTESEVNFRVGALHPKHQAEAFKMWKSAREKKPQIKNTNDAVLAAIEEEGASLSKDERKVFGAELQDRMTQISSGSGGKMPTFEETRFEARKLLRDVPKSGFDPTFRDARREWKREYTTARQSQNFTQLNDLATDYTDQIPTWFQEREAPEIRAAIERLAAQGIDPTVLESRYEAALVQAWFESIDGAKTDYELNRLLADN